MGMRRRSWRWAILAVVGFLASLGIFAIWHRGRPYGAAEFSPNGLYYVQKYANWSFRSGLPAGPGQGTDGLSGYVRLFARGGQLLRERFVSQSRDVRPVWSGRNVYLQGVPEMDRAPWTLPAPAQ